MAHTHVLVHAETQDGELSSFTRQVMAAGRGLADSLSEELHVVLLGQALDSPARTAFAYGADRVFTVEDPRLARYDCDLHLQALAAVVARYEPRHLLFGHTDAGAELGTRLSFRLGRTLATDCISLSVGDGGALVATKPVYGGLAMATYVGNAFPQMATMRAKATAPLAPSDRHGPIVPVAVELDTPSRVSLIGEFTQAAQGVRFEDAEVIVAGGRGMGSSEGFQALAELAELLNGAVGASRVACDNGWIPSTVQVGITGHIVAPRLYVAVGISGASQHMSGCSKAKKIVAINKDASAPIFKQAHFGVVGDWEAVLPALMRKLRSMQ